MTNREMFKMKIPKSLKRQLSVSGVEVNIDERTVEFSLSSETPYERYFGVEILSHEKSAVDLSRLKNGAPILFNHQLNLHVGKILDAWLEEKTIRIKMKFGRSVFAAEKMQDVIDEILTKVSVGYQILEMVLVKKGKEGSPPEYMVTKWLPFEGSLVTIAADDTVGIGRTVDPSDEMDLLVEGEDEPAVENKNETKSLETNNNINATVVAQGKEFRYGSSTIRKSSRDSNLRIGRKI